MRRRLALLLFAALALHQLDVPMLTLPFRERAPIARNYAEMADAAWYPDYPRFLEGVRAHTRPGDTIAILVPTPEWDPGYAYAYYRASYFLTGREVLPLMTAEDPLVVQNFRRAQWVAVWNQRVPPGERVWSEHRGVLVRRR